MRRGRSRAEGHDGLKEARPSPPSLTIPCSCSTVYMRAACAPLHPIPLLAVPISHADGCVRFTHPPALGRAGVAATRRGSWGMCEARELGCAPKRRCWWVPGGWLLCLGPVHPGRAPLPGPPTLPHLPLEAQDLIRRERPSLLLLALEQLDLLLELADLLLQPSDHQGGVQLLVQKNLRTQNRAWERYGGWQQRRWQQRCPARQWYL
jgi:hypothetical protein